MRQRICEVFLFFLLSLLFFSGKSFADGCFFGYKDIEEPSQVGIILFQEGKEDLILFANARGTDTEFAWVIPVPSYPTVKEGDPDLFYDLSYLTTYRPHPFPFACGTGNIIFTSEETQDVYVWSSEDIGIYHVTVLSSESENALINWLNANGYKFPENAQDAVNYYVRNNYFFVAAKVKKKDEVNSSYYMGISPLHIYFSTDEIFYPLKISSISAAERTEVLLYIFDKQPRSYPGFSVEYSSYLTPAEYERYKSIGNLLKGGSFYLTKMRAYLSPEDMDEDMVFPLYSSSLPFNAPIFQILIIGISGILIFRKF